eukprot:gnl/MRDRNA2_/MRDRNA2_133304_c0_seq1.p1 gnl/MRDRNA2_/MRDRNA2_133304_c0~~gnl/MRDRNA2_/MRDRNA2_133304_c0_seq1.p1  ORF type:complete len:877 (+),score=138.64 gnl/MRDRNA2_/MRDRNA2_133304_c0_seq1:30-2660(+)
MWFKTSEDTGVESGEEQDEAPEPWEHAPEEEPLTGSQRPKHFEIQEGFNETSPQGLAQPSACLALLARFSDLVCVGAFTAVFLYFLVFAYQGWMKFVGLWRAMLALDSTCLNLGVFSASCETFQLLSLEALDGIQEAANLAAVRVKEPDTSMQFFLRAALGWCSMLETTRIQCHESARTIQIRGMSLQLPVSVPACSSEPAEAAAACDKLDSSLQDAHSAALAVTKDLAFNAPMNAAKELEKVLLTYSTVACPVAPEIRKACVDMQRKLFSAPTGASKACNGLDAGSCTNLAQPVHEAEAAVKSLCSGTSLLNEHCVALPQMGPILVGAAQDLNLVQDLTSKPEQLDIGHEGVQCRIASKAVSDGCAMQGGPGAAHVAHTTVHDMVTSCDKSMASTNTSCLALGRSASDIGVLRQSVLSKFGDLKLLTVKAKQVCQKLKELEVVCSTSWVHPGVDLAKVQTTLFCGTVLLIGILVVIVQACLVHVNLGMTLRISAGLGLMTLLAGVVFAGATTSFAAATFILVLLACQIPWIVRVWPTLGETIALADMVVDALALMRWYSLRTYTIAALLCPGILLMLFAGVLHIAGGSSRVCGLKVGDAPSYLGALFSLLWCGKVLSAMLHVLLVRSLAPSLGIYTDYSNVFRRCCRFVECCGSVAHAALLSAVFSGSVAVQTLFRGNQHGSAVLHGIGGLCCLGLNPNSELEEVPWMLDSSVLTMIVYRTSLLHVAVREAYNAQLGSSSLSCAAVTAMKDVEGLVSLGVFGPVLLTACWLGCTAGCNAGLAVSLVTAFGVSAVLATASVTCLSAAASAIFLAFDAARDDLRAAQPEVCVFLEVAILRVRSENRGVYLLVVEPLHRARSQTFMPDSQQSAFQLVT